MAKDKRSMVAVHLTALDLNGQRSPSSCCVTRLPDSAQELNEHKAARSHRSADRKHRRTLIC